MVAIGDEQEIENHEGDPQTSNLYLRGKIIV